MDFGPLHLWEQMTWIGKAVVIALLLLSVWTFYAAIERLLVFRKARTQSIDFARQVTQLLAQDRIQETVDASRKYRFSHIARVTRAGLIQFLLDHRPGQPLGALTGHDLVEAARRAIERETLIAHSDFKRGVGSLATIATTAPFIGLFGTVVGIINAFRGMAMTGSGGIAAVSSGIAEALVTTALGLLVAIPAAWIYNHFVNSLERFQVEMSNSSSELVDFFIKKHGGSHAAGVGGA